MIHLLPMDQLGAFLLALIAVLSTMSVTLFIFKRRQIHETFKRMQVDGPKPHLIHGHLYETRRQPYVEFADKMHGKYGKNVGVFLGGDPFLLTKDLDLIQNVFVAKSRLFYDRMNFYLNVDPVPDNLICQRGDRWRYMRRLLSPSFTHSKIRSSQFYRDTWQTVRKFMHQLNSSSYLDEKNQKVTLLDDSYDRMAAIALDVIIKTAFHMDDTISFVGPTNHLDEIEKLSSQHSDTFLDTVKRACRLGFNPLVELIFCFPFLDRPLTSLCNRLYFSSIIQLLFKRLDYLVRRDVKKENPYQRRRIIDSLIDVLRERKITRSEFTGNAFVIVFAGFETTANALTFTLWLLSQHQQIQRKLRHQLETKLSQMVNLQKSFELLRMGDDIDLSLVDSELNELATGSEYLEMVINESLRLYPPVPGLSCRQASMNCTLSNGMTIEKGVNILPSVFSIHRDIEIWGESADQFRPERFETLDETQLNSAMFMPFGLGPRNCIGKALAMHEMKIAVGLLVLGYSIECWPGLTPSELRLCSPINITLTNSESIPLKFVEITRGSDIK